MYTHTLTFNYMKSKKWLYGGAALLIVALVGIGIYFSSNSGDLKGSFRGLLGNRNSGAPEWCKRSPAPQQPGNPGKLGGPSAGNSRPFGGNFSVPGPSGNWNDGRLRFPKDRGGNLAPGGPNVAPPDNVNVNLREQNTVVANGRLGGQQPQNENQQPQNYKYYRCDCNQRYVTIPEIHSTKNIVVCPPQGAGHSIIEGNTRIYVYTTYPYECDPSLRCPLGYELDWEKIQETCTWPALFNIAYAQKCNGARNAGSQMCHIFYEYQISEYADDINCALTEEDCNRYEIFSSSGRFTAEFGNNVDYRDAQTTCINKGFSEAGQW